MMIQKVIEDIKTLLVDRRILQSRRDENASRMRKANDFFDQLAKSQTPDIKQAAEGIALFRKILAEVMEIEGKIWDIDSTIVSYMEVSTISEILQISSPDKVNDAGDLIQNQNFYIVPAHSSTDMVEISPEDLFTLRMIRASFGVNNLELINKPKYYDSAGKNTVTMVF